MENLCFLWDSLMHLSTKSYFPPEWRQTCIFSLLWRWHSGWRRWGHPSVFSLFFMNEIKKASEKSSIPPQPSIPVNHQGPSDSASKSPSQFSPVTHHRPDTRTMGWASMPYMNMCGRETNTKELEHAKVCKGPCNCRVWKHSLHDSILKWLWFKKWSSHLRI